jgi:oligopeptide transport system substrate-binding protein
LSSPFSLFTGVLTLPMTFPLREEFLTPDGRFDVSRIDALQFSAPYRLKEVVRDQKITIEAWKPGLHPKAPTKIEFTIVRDESTALSLFQSRRLDVLTKVPPYDLQKLRKAGNIQVFPYAATYFIGFNQSDERVKSLALRKRMRDSIHREEITRVLDSGEQPAYSFLPRDFPGFWEFSKATSHPAVSPKKGSPIPLTFDGSERNQVLMEKVQADLKRVGIEVTLQPQDWKTHAKSVYENPSPLFRFGWSTPLLDPIFFLLPFDRESGFALGGLPTKSLHPEMEAILALPPGEARTLKIERFQQRILSDEVWVIPLYHYVSVLAVNDRVEVIPVNHLGSFHFDDIRMK